MRPPERQEMLPHLRESLTRNFSEVSVSTPFGSTVRTENGQASITPGWKTFPTVLVVLYPVGMLLKRFLDPELDRADVSRGGWVSSWASPPASRCCNGH